MFRPFTKSLAPEKPQAAAVEVRPALTMGILVKALEIWERDGDPNAPLWLNFITPSDALRAREEITQRYRIHMLTEFGGILMVYGEDADRLIFIIKQLNANRTLEIQTAERLKYALKKNKNDSRTVTISYPSADEAITAKRLLAHHYALFDVIRDDEKLVVPKGSATEFLEKMLRE